VSSRASFSSRFYSSAKGQAFKAIGGNGSDASTVLKRSKKLWCTICATAKKGFLFIKRGGLGGKRLKERGIRWIDALEECDLWRALGCYGWVRLRNMVQRGFSFVSKRENIMVHVNWCWWLP
jgi:hypothetical protein